MRYLRRLSYHNFINSFYWFNRFVWYYFNLFKENLKIYRIIYTRKVIYYNFFVISIRKREERYRREHGVSGSTRGS